MIREAEESIQKFEILGDFLHENNCQLRIMMIRKSSMKSFLSLLSYQIKINLIILICLLITLTSFWYVFSWGKAIQKSRFVRKFEFTLSNGQNQIESGFIIKNNILIDNS